MRPLIEGLEKQRGASLLAVIFLMVAVAFFGTIVVSLVATQSFTSVNELQSTQALYVAEGGLERAVSYLLGPTLAGRVTCAGLPGAATSLNPGQFQLNSEAGSPFYSTTATAIPAGPGVTSAAATIPVVSTANYAPFGRIMIDRELIDYTGTTANSFTGALRGRDGTLATPHLAGTRVGQSQCTVTSTGGVIDLTASARGRRVQRTGIELQEAWAVGDNGTILRWNGTAWVLFTTTGTRLRSVSMDSYANGWAVGDVVGGRAQIRRWNPDGTPFWDGPPTTPLPPPGASVRLNAIHSFSQNAAWAVGNTGGAGGAPCSANALILQWTGAAWNCVASPSNQRLNAVSMFDTDNNGVVDDGWAVGDSGGGGAGLCTNARILRWNGVAWNCVASPSNQNLNAVFMVSAADGWAVGDSGGGGAGLCTNARILRWNGVAWNCVASPSNRNLNGLFMVSATDGWAVGDSGGGGAGLCTNARILRWNGVAWNCVASPTNQNLRAVACATTNDCWAVGNGGTIVHWDGAAWTVHPQSGVVTGQNLRSIHIVAPRTRPQAAWREVVS